MVSCNERSISSRHMELTEPLLIGWDAVGPGPALPLNSGREVPPQATGGRLPASSPEPPTWRVENAPEHSGHFQVTEAMRFS